MLAASAASAVGVLGRRSAPGADGSYPAAMDAAAVQARVAEVHAQLIAAGTPPNEAAAIALKHVAGLARDSAWGSASPVERNAADDGGSGGASADAGAAGSIPDVSDAAASWPMTAAAAGVTPFKKLLPKASTAAERASRLVVRMPSGDAIETSYVPHAPVEALLEFLVSGKALKV